MIFFCRSFNSALNGRCHHEPGLRDADVIQIFARAGERDLEVTGVRAEERLIQTVIKHLVAHPAKAAAAFLDAMEVGEALCQHRIAGAGPVFAPAQTGESDGRRRQAGTGDDHAVSKDFEHDFPASVLVLPMGHGVDQGFPQRLDGIFVQPDAIEANDAHRMAGVPVNEGDGAVNRSRHRPADVFMVVGIAIRFRTAIRIGQNTALGKNRRRVFRQQHDASGGGVMFPGLRVMPDQAAHRRAREQVADGEFLGGPEVPTNLPSSDAADDDGVLRSTSTKSVVSRTSSVVSLRLISPSTSLEILKVRPSARFATR